MVASAGRFSTLVRFDRRVEGGPDAGGTPEGSWEPFAHVWAKFRPRYGRERVQAGRLESTFDGTLTVRVSPNTKTLTAADRVVFPYAPYNGLEAQIRSIVPLPKNDGFEIVIEFGVAQ